MPSRVECTVYCHRRVVGQPSELPERGCTANSDHMASHRAMPRTILEHYTLGNATELPNEDCLAAQVSYIDVYTKLNGWHLHFD
jgi:hypothetical protein